MKEEEEARESEITDLEEDLGNHKKWKCGDMPEMAELLEKKINEQW